MTRAFTTRFGLLSLVGAAAAIAATASGPQATLPRPPAGSDRPVRALIGSVPREMPLAQKGAWQLIDASGNRVAKDTTTERWSLSRDGRRLRVIQAEAPVTPWIEGPLTLELADGVEATWQKKGYRGTLTYVATDSALLVVNRVDVEDYLRSVVPLEIGGRLTSDHAAVEAQAVAARSFTYTKMIVNAARDFDVRATEADQVYAGTSAETFWGDLAVSATAGWVLSYRGQVVTAPYHSACGGTTALPSEVWRGGRDGYLRSVSDTSATTGRPWCDLSPRVNWERRLSVQDLAGAITSYASTYVKVPEGAASSVRGVRVDGTSSTGRVKAIVFETAAGDLTVRGTDVRYVVRPVGGAILPTSAFTVETERGDDGQLLGVVVRGRGNGHGVGMCQWGAIARARAGDDFRAILKAYYPGASLIRAP
jgi:stage II sporulation protein D (peptidoglycan lytic transglycosylase)